MVVGAQIGKAIEEAVSDDDPKAETDSGRSPIRQMNASIEYRKDFTSKQKIIWYMRQVQKPITVGELKQFWGKNRHYASDLSSLVYRGLIEKVFEKYQLTDMVKNQENPDFVSMRDYKIDTRDLETTEVCDINLRREVYVIYFSVRAKSIERLIKSTA